MGTLPYKVSPSLVVIISSIILGFVNSLMYNLLVTTRNWVQYCVFLETMYKVKGLGLRINLEDEPCYSSGNFFSETLGKFMEDRRKNWCFNDALFMGPTCFLCPLGHLMMFYSCLSGRKVDEKCRKKLTACALMQFLHGDLKSFRLSRSSGLLTPVVLYPKAIHPE